MRFEKKRWLAVASIVALVAVLALTAAGAVGNDEPSDGDGSITALEVDDVWVFQHEPEAGDDALHSGVASIKDGCLFVGDAVVVWTPDQLVEVAATIGAVLDGEGPTLTLGGGGISVAEGDAQIPPAIAERCETTEVWFSAP